MAQMLKMTSKIRTFFIAVMVSGLISGTAVYAKWSFGVIADNQDAAGTSHGLVATATIHQIDSQFIIKGVKLVIQVGDELNAPQKGIHGDLSFAAAEAEFLYKAGIGFFPMRGNHEAQSDLGNSDYTMTMFRTTNFPQTQGGSSHLFGATNFSSPKDVDPNLGELDGLSYCFDYFSDGASARFLVIDDWGTIKTTRYNYLHKLGALGDKYPGGYTSYALGYSIGEQQPWISSRLDKNTRGTDHAFVFSHHNLIGAFHYDCLFGYSNDSLDRQNTFIASLLNNGVRYYTSGHEHLYNRSIFTSPDGNSWVQDINCASAGPKFIPPTDTGASLGIANEPEIKWFFGQKGRQTQISQELYNVGFYIYTIDGPRVTVDYYSDATGGYGFNNGKFTGTGWADGATPTFNFVKKETWGYSLNGKEFRIAQGQPYSVVSDAFSGTSAAILSGVNSCTASDAENHRPFTKVVNTGWATNDGSCRSNILTLWGMADFGTPDVTHVFALSMSYNPATTGSCALMSKNGNGEWVHAADLNSGAGSTKFVAGPFKETYGLGTYGIDFSTKTVWAVINHASSFAVHASIDGDQDNDNDVDNDDVAKVLSFRNKPASDCPSADVDNDGRITVLDAKKVVLLRTQQ